MPVDPPAGEPTPAAPAFLALSEMAAQLSPVAWLWPGWVPRGLLTLLCAAPGAGKSYLALDLARRLIHGESFPDGSPPFGPPATVLYVDAERTPQIINERAVAWNMDRTRLFLCVPKPAEIYDLTRIWYQARLLEMVTALHPALVVVDSLAAACSGGEINTARARAMLGFLAGLAARHQMGLLLIHHLRKNGSRFGAAPVLEDVRGPGHIVTMVRSVLGLSLARVGLDLDRGGPRRLEVLKTNLGPYPAPLEITFEPLAPWGATLKYGPAPEPYRPLNALEMCAKWIVEILKEEGKPLTPTDLICRAERIGYSRATVFRARDVLGRQIVDTRGRRHPENRWALPGTPSKT